MNTIVAEQALALVDRMNDCVTGGLEVGGQKIFLSARELAFNYQQDRRFETNEARIDDLIAWQTARNAATGFVSGLGGVITWPVALPAALGASWVIQARLAATIAELRGYSTQDERTRTFVLLTLLGNECKEVIKSTGVKISECFARKMIEQIPGKLIHEINRKVGTRLLTKAGEKGIINLTKCVPVVGAVVAGAADGVSCHGVGQVARQVFR